MYRGIVREVMKPEEQNIVQQEQDVQSQLNEATQNNENTA